MNELLNSVNQTLKSMEEYCHSHNLSLDIWPQREVQRVLTLMKDKLINGKNLEDRLLRAMKDIYVISFRNFDKTSVHENIEVIDNKLRNMYAQYEKLEPLGMDFGKEDPI